MIPTRVGPQLQGLRGGHRKMLLMGQDPEEDG